jgi:hypothetical protein
MTFPWDWRREEARGGRRRGRTLGQRERDTHSLFIVCGREDKRDTQGATDDVVEAVAERGRKR